MIMVPSAMSPRIPQTIQNAPESLAKGIPFTLIPSRPVMKVSGRKIVAIQLSRYIDPLISSIARM